MCERRDGTVNNALKPVLKCTLPEHEGDHYDGVMFTEWEAAPKGMNDVEFRNWEQSIIGKLHMGGPQSNPVFSPYGFGW